ncbi:PR domain zinc finger protein 5-like [Centruroides vittatus]|uniref:PR domain zinc finger protein 5-like n=1 Tax=Centruroides vittatus TaxID=120091 RepID=UPI0035105808
MDDDDLIKMPPKRKAEISYGTDIVKSHKLLKYKEMQNLNNTELRTKDMSLEEYTGKEYICKICSDKFQTAQILNIHMWTHGSATEPFQIKSFLCLECKKTYSIHSFFLQHLKINHNSLHFCKYCPLSFETLSTMKLHVKTMHKSEIIKRGNDIAKFACVFCQACYFTVNHLVTHLCKYHHKDEISNDYYPICNTAYEHMCSSDITIDKENKMPKQTEIKNFKSNVQNKVLKNIPVKNSKLMNNRQSCSYKVTKNLTKQTTLKTMKYNCSHCNIKFLRSHHLQNHKQKHHKIDKFFVPTYGCAKCPAKFFKNSFLQHHLTSHHKLSVTPKI